MIKIIGYHGKVFKAINKKTNVKVAIKKIEL